VTFRPLNDRVLIRPDKPKERTASGLYIPRVAQEAVYHGKVLRVGSGEILPTGHRRKLDLRRGDRVVFDPRKGVDVRVAGEDLLILQDKDIDYVCG
jgi:chaperonin GroES